MYLPAAFEQHDRAAVLGLIHAHPLATVIVNGVDGPVADHLPLEWDEGEQALIGHVARANPLWQQQGVPVLAVFQGAQSYVTPSWYESKAEHGRVVPTWNYTVVHAHGTLEAHDDPALLHRLVSRLTDRHEADHASSWQVGDAPAEFTAQLLRAIVGIRIPVHRLVGKWKVSQNRPAADREGVARGMAALGEAGMAALVRAG